MKTEKEKMVAGEPYDAFCEELTEIRTKVKQTLHKLNVTEYYTENFRGVINELCPNAAKDLNIVPPFYCDYGENIHAAEGVFFNSGACVLDGAIVTIGKKTLMAPGVHIYTAQHPVEVEDRRTWEDCKPVTIGEECWIGGHSTILPGVTIGDRVVIGAGSVVTKDIPSDSLAVGNPARVVRKINQKLNK
jgi:maltose O-acetyltransferase